MYSVLHYGEMALDGVRMDAYARAIERAVRPGSVVVDIGAGTGILTLLALHAGARLVHAIEPNPAVWVLADLALENGLADRVVIHHASSFDVVLEERADVVISDLRGSVPLNDQHLAILRDAKARLLSPGGVILPESDELVVGLVEDDRLASDLAAGAAPFERRGLHAEAVRRSIMNTPARDERGLGSNALLTAGARWGRVVYGTSETTLDGTVDLVARRSGTAHALAVWFEARILGEIAFSTEPGCAMTYHRMLLPLLEPVSIAAGDRVRLTVRASETGDRWAWDTEVTAPSGQAKVRLRQSSFFGMPSSPAALLRASSTFTPELGPRGVRTKRILDLMDGKRSVAEIAREAGEAGDGARLDEVRSLVSTYAR
jgi:protein arginine N-methyltransferase 1